MSACRNETQQTETTMSNAMMYTSQPIEVSTMFYQVNDFIVLIHVALKDKST